jgi:DNA-binding beta-propeller fold protein YncE
MKHGIILSAALLTLAAMTACGLGKNDNASWTSGSAVIANTDYSTGSLSSLDISGTEPSNDILKGSVDSDLKVRSHNGILYVLNNRNMNIQLIDPSAGFTTLAQENTGDYSYPGDIAFSGTKGYAALNGSSSLLVIDASTLKTEARISLAAYAPSGASTPSIDRLWFDETTGYLFVSMQRIVYVNYLASIDYSAVAVIDTKDNSVKKVIELTWNESGTDVFAKDPYSKFVYASETEWSSGDGHPHIFLLCAGLFNADYSDKKDGGIVAIDTADLECEAGFVVSEASLDAAMNDFDYANGSFYIAVNTALTSCVCKTSSAGELQTTIKSIPIVNGSNIPFVKADSSGKIIFGDRTPTAPGVWVLDAASGTFTTSAVIPTGLPPYDIALIK